MCVMCCDHAYLLLGHSFYGRCGADDSMQISVHYNKKIEVDLNCTEHEEGCITMGSGVQWGEAHEKVRRNWYRIQQVASRIAKTYMYI